MKKILLILSIMIITLLSGCSKTDEKTIKDKFLNSIIDLNSYYLEGNLELSNNDDTYTYDVKVSYQKDDYYKVELNNKGNNYQQIIIKNTDGVYVVTHKSTKQKI